MAVKQNNTENAGGSNSSPHNGSQINPGQTSELRQILGKISLPDSEPLSRRSNENDIKICEFIVHNLNKVVLPKDKTQLKKLREDINYIQSFLIKNYGGDKGICLYYLRTVHSMIIGTETPSCAITAVFDLFPENWIDRFSNTEHISDANIRKAVTVLCFWLRTCFFCQNLHLWVLAILRGICQQRRWDLLTTVAVDVVEPLFNALIVPILRSKIAPVIFYLLSSVKQIPTVFHKVILRAPKVIKHLKNDAVSNEETNEILQNLVDVLSALMLEFPDNGFLYKETEEVLKGFTPSSDYKTKKFDFCCWSSLPTTDRATGNAKVGLINLGNTCYMNSVLQALALTKEFCREILLNPTSSSTFKKLQQLLALMLYSVRPEIAPGPVLQATRPPGFVAGLQQDSSEFLSYLLELLHEHEKIHQRGKFSSNFSHDTMSTDGSDVEDGATSQCLLESASSCQNEQFFATAIDKAFAGKIATLYKCMDCHYESKNVDTFRDLQLSFPEVKTDCVSNYSVQDLVDYYCSSEKLDGENQYFCEKCKKLCDAHRSMKVVKAPKNIILTLKHFKYDQKYHTRAKLMHKVYHDENVSLKVYPDISNGSSFLANYILYAAVVHSGFSMDSGHYYTYGAESPGRWYKFNDNVVSVSSTSELHSSHPPNTPYILFYRMSSKSDNCSINVSQSLTKIEESSLPSLTDLSPSLLQFVSKDNSLYNEEVYRVQYKRINVDLKTTNNKNTNDKRDNDDDPPGTCGSNALNYFNRFIY